MIRLYDEGRRQSGVARRSGPDLEQDSQIQNDMATMMQLMLDMQQEMVRLRASGGGVGLGSPAGSGATSQPTTNQPPTNQPTNHQLTTSQPPTNQPINQSTNHQ